MLPVSIVEMPSIMMLLAPPPPSRPGLAPEPTPGASEASPAKPRLAMGRFSTDSFATLKERSPLDAWMTGVSA